MNLFARVRHEEGLLAALLFGTALLGAPSPASAYEDQATLFVDLGYGAALANDALPTHGAQLGLGGSFGHTFDSECCQAPSRRYRHSLRPG